METWSIDRPMETWSIDDDARSPQVHLCLLDLAKSGENTASELLSRLLSLKSDSLQGHLALIRADMILDKHALIYALRRTFMATQSTQQLLSQSLQFMADVPEMISSESRMTARDMQQECIFQLSPSDQIQEALRKFGLSDTTRYVLALRLGGTRDEFLEKCRLLQVPLETAIPLTELENVADRVRLFTVFKISPQIKDESFIRRIIYSSAAVKHA